MAEIKNETGFKNKDVLNFISIKKEPNASVAEMRQEVNTNVAEKRPSIDMSLIKIKKEPTDCNRATALVNFMHQEINAPETMSITIKKEMDSDTDVSHNNNVTVNLLIPDTILTEKTKSDMPKIIAEHSSQNSEMQSTPSVLPVKKEDSILSSDFTDIIPAQSVPARPMRIQSVKRKNDSECLEVESLTPQCSTDLNKTAIEPPKHKRKFTRRKIYDITPAEVSVSEFGTADLEDPTPSAAALTEIVLGSQQPTPHSSAAELTEKVLGSEQPKKRGRAQIKEKTVCPFCDRKMAKQYFPYHVRVHTDEKPFKCPKCSYTSHFKAPLIMHMEVHHPTEVL